MSVTISAGDLLLPAVTSLVTEGDSNQAAMVGESTGVMILIVGFGFHWLSQLISLLNWEFATKIGIQEEGLLPEYKVYEHAVAVADVAIGWIYGFAGVGLVLGTQWGFKLAWFPGVVLTYHAIGFWVWTANRRKAGHQLTSTPIRIGWSLANSIVGALAILIAWNAY